MNNSKLRSLALLPLVSIAMASIAPEARADDLEEMGAPPPGYHFEKKRHIAPIIVGASLFGVGWLAADATALLGMIASTNVISTEPRTNWTTNFIPLVGPFVTLGMQPESQRSDGMTAALAIMGGTQLVGAGLLIGGLAAGKRDVLVRDKRGRVGATLSVQPVVGPSTAGFLMGGSF